MSFRSFFVFYVLASLTTATISAAKPFPAFAAAVGVNGRPTFTVVAQAGQSFCTFSGFIEVYGSNSPVKGARVTLTSESLQKDADGVYKLQARGVRKVLIDASGNYNITVPCSTYSLKFGAPGYATQTDDGLQSSVVMNIALMPLGQANQQAKNAALAAWFTKAVLDDYNNALPSKCEGEACDVLFRQVASCRMEAAPAVQIYKTVRQLKKQGTSESQVPEATVATLGFSASAPGPTPEIALQIAKDAARSLYANRLVEETAEAFAVYRVLEPCLRKVGR